MCKLFLFTSSIILVGQSVSIKTRTSATTTTTTTTTTTKKKQSNNKNNDSNCDKCNGKKNK